jgi:C4-dicarboxylate-specific signal transduction histidine kinase
MGDMKSKLTHILDQELATIRTHSDRIEYIIENGPKTAEDIDIMIKCLALTNFILKARAAGSDTLL